MFDAPHKCDQRASIAKNGYFELVQSKSATPQASDSYQLPTDQWTSFGFTPAADAGAYILPTNVVAFEADAGVRLTFARFLAGMETPPTLALKTADSQKVFFRVADPALAVTLARSVPAGVRLIAPGEPIVMPSEAAKPNGFTARTVDQLSELTAVEISRVAKVEVTPIIPPVNSNPLMGYSLIGQSASFRERAIAATPLLGDLCLSGQVTAWYAAPNTGKTLIALNLLVNAIRAGRIAGGNVFYLNADDSSEGMATKMELTDDLGVHTLAPGFGGFNPSDLLPRLHQMAEREQARGVFILVDTTKKFVSLMDKKDSSAFAGACRRVAMAGGAILNLAHTNKRPNADGTPCFAGTTDLVDDADAAYTIQAVDTSGLPGERLVQFTCFKQRGDNVDRVAYAYAAENGVSYPERLASVRLVDLATVDRFVRVEEQRMDEDVVQVIAGCILDGFNTKMLLGQEAAGRANISARHAYRMIERYTGDDPVQHRWRFTVRERGAKMFELLPPPPG